MEAFISTECGGEQVVVRYSRVGVGSKVVVLLHGYGQSLEVWEAMAGELGRRYEVVMLDIVGSGLSSWGEREIVGLDFMAEGVSGVLEKLGVGNYTVVGHSMGGYVGCALVGIEPERVDGLVLLHSVPMSYSEERRESVLREIEIIESGKKEMLANSNPTKGFRKENVRKFQDDIDEKIEQFMLTPDKALTATLRGLMQREDMSTAVKEYSAQKPVMMVFGEHDPYISGEVREVAMERVPNATVEMLENSAHMGFIEERERVIEILDAFFLDKQ